MSKIGEITQILGIPEYVVGPQITLAKDVEQGFLIGDISEDKFFADYQTIEDARKVRMIQAIVDSGGDVNDLESLKDSYISVTPVWEGERLFIGKISGDKIDVPFENIFGYVPENGMLIYTNVNGLSLKGGEGSGNWGHQGLAGVWGGSSPTKSLFDIEKFTDERLSKNSISYNEAVELLRRYGEGNSPSREVTRLCEIGHYSWNEPNSAARIFFEKNMQDVDSYYGEGSERWNDMYGYSSTGLYFRDKNDVELRLTIGQEDGHVYLRNINKKPETGVLGYRFMKALKKYCDITQSNLTIYMVANIEYFSRFDWLEYSVPGTFKYFPQQNRTTSEKGGQGSGNWGHQGLAGVWGGSSPTKQVGWNPVFGDIDKDWIKKNFKPVIGLSPEQVCFKTFEAIAGVYLNPEISLEENIRDILENEPQRLYKMSQTIYNYLENKHEDWQNPYIYTMDDNFENYQKSVIPREHIELIQDIVDPFYNKRISYIQRELGIPTSLDGLKEFLGEDIYNDAMQIRLLDEESGLYLFGENFRQKVYRVEKAFAEKFSGVSNEAIQSIHADELNAALTELFPYEGLNSAYEIHEAVEDVYEYEIMRRLCTGDIRQEGDPGYIRDRSNFNGFYLQDIQNGRNFSSLPDRLYHVTTGASGVEKSGIMSRRELAWETASENEVGLGGGSDKTISFTDDRSTAQGIYRAINEAYAVANGKYTMSHMIADAITGGKRAGGAEPFFRNILGRYAEKTEYYKKFIDENGKLKIKDILDGGELDSRMRASLEYEAGVPNVSIDKNKYMEILWDFWHTSFIGMRSASGGFMNPLFWGTDWKRLAQLDPRDFAILEYVPKSDRAKGVLMGSLGEWRIVGSSAVKLENIIQEVWEDFDLETWLGGA